MHKKLKVRSKKILGEKKIWMKKHFEKKNKTNSENESCLKLPELPRNHVWGGGGGD